MSDISVLERRVRAALERIAASVDEMPFASEATAAPSVSTSVPVDDALRRQLEEERTVSAQLEERVRALKERQDSKLSGLEAQVQGQRDQMADYDREMQRLQQANAELRAVAAEMREALMDGVSEPELVNRAVIAELDAIKAAQAADRAEVEAIMSQLGPLMKEAQ